jgi:5'-3' exoribonuclease 2
MHLDIDTKDRAEKKKLVDLFRSYSEGLAWVMRYYYQGCASWSWYYPYHYAPFASGLTCVSRFKHTFELAAPFKPLAQLMGVLPSTSAHCMPPVCRELMQDSSSPIIDFYPTDFKCDLNGKKYTWQAVSILPFIDEVTKRGVVCKFTGYTLKKPELCSLLFFY